MICGWLRLLYTELLLTLSTNLFFFLPGLDLLWQANENFRSFIISSHIVSYGFPNTNKMSLLFIHLFDFMLKVTKKLSNA